MIAIKPTSLEADNIYERLFCILCFIFTEW